MAKKLIITRHISVQKLQTRIRYAFKDPNLLALVLRHKSKGPANNERLEALGKKVLELVIVEALYKIYPGFDEGKLTGISHRICSNYSMHDHAGAIGLRIYGFRVRVDAYGAALADAFQALIAAIHIDGGLEAVKSFILQEFERDLNNPTPAPQYQMELQRFMREHFNRDPIYENLTSDGAKLAGHFTYAVMDGASGKLGKGRGNDAAEARTNAARVALDYLKTYYPKDAEEED